MKRKRGLKMDEKIESPLTEDESFGAAVVETELIRNDSPSHDEIALLAYSYWEARGFQGGSPVEDWLRAQAELRGQKAGEKARSAGGCR
jgi:hypothetical protein